MKTLASAESCTGGLLGKLLTDRPGASKFYRGGVIAYHNDAKIVLLGVPKKVLGRYGAVSAETAQCMAVGVREKLKATIGISITGIAGPSGGSRSKPVGLVFIALATKDRAWSKRFLFKGKRADIRKKAAAEALAWLKKRSI
jgi:PncC family amidohydrolase